MKNNSKFTTYFELIIIGILILGFFLGLPVLRNKDNSKNEDITKNKSSSGTIIFYDYTPYGSVSAGSPFPDPNEQDYLEWSITTNYGPGFTWYMMNDTEFANLNAIPKQWRTRGNFSYTSLLSDEEASASGTFYPQYEDTWWLVTINHWFGFNCSASYTDNWQDDFITVDEPTSSSSWEANTSQYIAWTWGGDFNYVDIDLYYDGNFSRNIAINAQNNGSYLWSIPDDISLFDDLYQVNISNSDFAATWGMSDQYFEITQIRSINVTSPSTSDSWETGTPHYISWTTTGTINDVKIELFKSGIFELLITSSTPNDGDFPLYIPLGLDNSTQYQIKITDESDSSLYDYSDYFEIYTIDSITVISPSSISSWETGTTHSISWDWTGTITHVKIELFKSGILELVIISSTPNDGDFPWIIPSGLDNSTQYQIKITDVSNSAINDYSDYFEIYTTPSIPPAIPGYDLMILISTSIVSVIGLTYLLYNRKKEKSK
ncbi:MAG: Ser-Thr-rich GPI-anchored membrane family protein [Candidatus Hodarchaeota archaeon]